MSCQAAERPEPAAAEEQAPFMGWKLRKDKLREGQADAPSAPGEPAAPSDFSAAAQDETARPEDVALNSLPSETEAAFAPDAPFDLSSAAADAPFDLSSTAFAPLPLLPSEGPISGSTVPSSDVSGAIALPAGTDAEAESVPAHDPLNFAPASDLDSVIEGLGSGEEDAPVFGLDSVFVPLPGDDEPVFVPAAEDDAAEFAAPSSAFDPLPDEAADAIAMPMSGSAPIVLGEDATGGFGAFVPYQPQVASPEQDAAEAGLAADDDAYSDPDLEVGGMAFAPQSPSFGTFDPHAPTAGEEIAQEPLAPDFTDTADTSFLSFGSTVDTPAIAFGSAVDTAPIAFGNAPGTAPMTFEPSFEAPEALAGETQAPDYIDPNAPFMDQDSLAPGLVSMEAGTGLPRVAPFVLPGGENPDFADDSSGPHSLVLRLGALSATYPLVKPVTTIGRPDRDTNTYPDVEVDLDDGVSRRHAEVRLEDDKAYIVDVGSTNGTILNGEMLTPQKPEPLMRGDRIRIGERVEIVFG